MRAKMILRNIAAVPVGILTFILALFITSFIEDLLLRIPILVTILSWPSSPELYLTVITLSVSAQASMMASRAVSEESYSGRRIGYAIFTCAMGAFYLIGAVITLFSGWSDVIPAMFLVGIFFAFMFIEELNEKALV